MPQIKIFQDTKRRKRTQYRVAIEETKADWGVILIADITRLTDGKVFRIGPKHGGGYPELLQSVLEIMA